MKTTHQIEVDPNTATFQPIQGGKHFGYATCPFCAHRVLLVGPPKQIGIVYAADECAHSQGAVDGGGCITVMFTGVPND